MRIVKGLLATLFAVSVLAQVAAAQQPPAELPEEAKQRLEHMVGKWEVTTRFYGSDGEVAREVKLIDTNRYAIGDRVVEHTSELDGEVIAKGLIFYNVREEKFCISSVDPNGDLWILTGGLDKFVLTSRKREQPDGSVMVIRFTHENIEPDSFEAQMEISRDGGETWNKGYRQFIKRIKEDAGQ